MAGPITWQNVAAPNFADAFRGMAQAQQSVDGAFDGLGNLIKKREATDTANWDQGKVNNTNEMLNGVLEPTTPEEFKAREAQLRQQLTGYGAQVDATAARSALDNRLSTLQQRATAGWAYDNAATDQKEASTVREAMTAIANRDPLTANIVMSGNPNLRKMAEIAAANTAMQRQAHADGQGDTTFANAQSDQRMQEELHPGVKQLQQAQIRAANEAAATSRASRTEKNMSTGLNKLLLQHNQGYGADIDGWNNNVKAIGQQMKLPINAATGMPDLSAVNPETLQLFKSRIGTPPSSSERLAVFKKQMSDAGVPLKQQVEAEALFDKSFGSGASISEVDQKNLETKTKQLDERLAARKKGNMLYSGSEEDKNAEIQATQTFFDGQMKDTLWVGSHKKAIDDIMFNGLKLNGETYPIPPKLMKLALSTSMDKDSNVFNTTEGQVKAFLTDYVQTPGYAKELAAATEIEADPTGNVAKKRLVDSYSRPTMSTGPVQYMNSLTDIIDSANARAQAAAAAEAQKKSR